MSFLARENRQTNQNEPVNRTFGRGGITNQVDPAQLNQKMSQQQLYKQELQRQIMQKQQRKKKQEEKNRKEDQKFMQEIQQVRRKQNQQKQRQKAKQQRAFDNANNNTNLSPNPKKQLNNKQNNKASRVVGTLNIGVRDQRDQRQQRQQRDQRQQQSISQLPKLSFDLARQQYQENPPAYTGQRRKQYIYDDYEPANQYYQERIRRHKQQMNQKLDQLFNHIHSTKDHIKADQEIEKIKRRLRSKQSVGNQFGGGDSQVQLEYENKFYHIPKKMGNDYNRSPGKSRVLDYQSTSKFTRYNNVGAQSRTKVRTQYEDLYSLPQIRQNQTNYADKWGSKPDQGKFLGNRQALDFQIAKTLGDINQFQTYLNKRAE